MEVSVLKELEISKAASAAVIGGVAGKVAENSTKQAVFHRGRKLMSDGGSYGTGRRKSSVARVWIRPGKGIITINKKEFSAYFAREYYRNLILQPFVDTNTSGQYDVSCTVSGGGTTGQAGAVLHGVARALSCISEDFYPVLRKNGLLTRDSRAVERKKYGKRKARKSTQYSKR